MAPRLKQAVRLSDTVARFGGDEFGILLEDISGEHEAVEMAERIAAVFTRPFVLAGREHFVTTSIGIAIARGGELAEELIRDADAAMYRAKEHGRARYELFDEVMRGRAIARLRVENDLRRALERDELRARLPAGRLAARTTRSCSVEALLRWDHPERGRRLAGRVHPDRRGERADRADRPLGARAGVPPGGAWHRDRPDARRSACRVNLSPIQVAKRGLAETVAEVLARAPGSTPAA